MRRNEGLKRVRLNLTVSKEVQKDMKKRKKLNISKYLEDKYRDEFMNILAVESEIEYTQKRLDELFKKKLAIKEDDSIIKAKKEDPRRCKLCGMFFNETISFRNKVELYKNISVCRECWISKEEECKALMDELKQKDMEEKANELDKKTSSEEEKKTE